MFDVVSWHRRSVLALALAAFGLASVARADDAALDTSRLVTIGGAVTEIVFALGEGDWVIARDSTSYFPQAAMKLPDVGYMRALSPEGVLSVNPSAILMIEGSGPKEAIEVLKKASVPMVTVPEGYDGDAITAKIIAVGRAIGADDKARELAEKVAADVDAAQAAVADIPEAQRKRVLFVLSTQNGKIMAAGGHTAADGIIRLAGAINVSAGYQGYKALNDEAIIEGKPDFILMMQRHGATEATDEDILDNPAIASTPAGRNRALVRMGGMTLLGFGPRTADAIRELSHTLYGG